MRYIVLKLKEKVVVCSEWLDFLEYAQSKLQLGKIRSLLMKDCSKIDLEQLGLFRTSQDYNVLMISPKNIADYSNLKCASHLIFVSSSCSSQEEQLVSRRILEYGPNHESYVYKFLVNRTLETSIENLKEKKNQDKSQEEEIRISLLDFDDLYKLF